MATRAEEMQRRFEKPVIVATLLVIPVIIVQGVGADEPWETIAYTGDWAIWLVFLAEVVAMLIVSENRWGWIKRNPLDVLIVILTPPVTPSVLKSARLLRLLRLVRIFRLAPLMRTVFTIQGVQYAAFLAFLTLIAGGYAFSSAENNATLADGLYWAIGTMTTAGSGPIEAHTNTTEAVAAGLMVVGLSFTAVLTGALAQRFIVTEDTVTEGNRETLANQIVTHDKLDDLAERLARLEAALSRGGGPQGDTPKPR
jgi:voltage-gated potassium channel